MRPVTRKRLEWLGTLAASSFGFGAYFGDIHAYRWPEQGTWSARDRYGRPVRGPYRKRR